MQNRGIVIIGAGLTGLSTAHNLKKKGHDVVIVEKESRIGGQIRTYQEDGFVYESGPNTGVVSFPEVVELFNDLAGDCELEIARESSKRRLIWKGNQFHALPSGPLSAITTPLFRLSDKFRILGEPWRKRGTDPDEPVGALAQRRLGKSFYEYAVDPFVSGVYAGDPMKLTTRYALPKLYNLEANYGSFIRGAMAKAKEPKTDRDRLATKKVFSAVGGLSQMVDAMAKGLDIILDANNVKIRPADGESGLSPSTARRKSDASAWSPPWAPMPCRHCCHLSLLSDSNHSPSCSMRPLFRSVSASVMPGVWTSPLSVVWYPARNRNVCLESSSRHHASKAVRQRAEHFTHTSSEVPVIPTICRRATTRFVRSYWKPSTRC